MTASPPPRPDDATDAATNAGANDHDRAEAAEQSAVHIDEDAVRELADQDDADTDSLI